MDYPNQSNVITKLLVKQAQRNLIQKKINKRYVNGNRHGINVLCRRKMQNEQETQVDSRS